MILHIAYVPMECVAISLLTTLKHGLPVRVSKEEATIPYKTIQGVACPAAVQASNDSKTST